MINLIANWNLNQAREIAWSTALAPWEARDIPVASDLLRASLGRAVAATSQLLLVALWCRQRRRGFKGRRGQDPVKAAREPGHWTVTAQLTRPCFSR